MAQQGGDDIAAAVRKLVREFAVGVRLPEDLPDDLEIGDGGLGFDSVVVVELLLACEERFDVAIPAELVEGAVITVGTLVDWIRLGDGGAP